MIAKILPIALLALIGLPLIADDPTQIPVWMCIQPFKGDPNDELVKYKGYMRKALEPIWRRETTANQSSMWFGEVRIRCNIHSDGTVTNPAIIVGESCGLLKTISMHTLVTSAPFKPFSEALIKETGGSYSDDISFTVTRRQLPPPQAEDHAYGGVSEQSSSTDRD